GQRIESHPALDEFPCPVSGGIPENVPVIWHYRRLKGGLTFSLRLLQGESRLQAAGQLNRPMNPRVACQQGIGAIGNAHVGSGVRPESVELARRHPDNNEIVPVQRDGPSHHLWISRKPPPPETVAEHGGRQIGILVRVACPEHPSV